MKISSYDETIQLIVNLTSRQGVLVADDMVLMDEPRNDINFKL